MRIVLTRDPGQAGALERGLEDAGFPLSFLPLTEQRLPEQTEPIRDGIRRLGAGGFSWLLITSANTVRALLRCGWEGTVPQDTQLGVTGPGTAAILGELTSIAEPWMPSGAKSAAGILRELPAPGTGSRLFLPQSAQARPRLSDGLRQRGWIVSVVTVYETVPVERPTAGDQPPGSGRRLLPPPEARRLLGPSDLTTEDVLLVTSSSAAEVFARLSHRPVARMLAIGAPTAQTMRSLGLPLAGVLAEPTAAGVVDALTASR